MRFSGQLLMQSRSFWAVLGLTAVANIWTFFDHPECCDRFDRVGFPFPFHLSGGITGTAEFYPIGMMLNLFIALTLAVIAARIGILLKRRD